MKDTVSRRTCKTGPVQVNDLIYLQNQYAGAVNGAPNDPNVLGGYLDTRGPDPAGYNLLGVSAAASSQREPPWLTGTWRFTM